MSSALFMQGKEAALSLYEELSADLLRLKKEGVQPSLAVVSVGDDAASQVYIAQKEKACARLGIASRVYRLAAHASQVQLEALLGDLSADNGVDAILCQMPLPAGLDPLAAVACIDPEKDADGLHPVNQGRMNLGLAGLRPCTPSGVIYLLKHYNIETAKKKAAVVGRSFLVGRPLAIMLGQPGLDATVVLCHSRTPALPKILSESDIIVCAAGQPGLISKECVKPGAVVIDVGISRAQKEGKAILLGDVAPDAAQRASFVSPVPGGVGPLTIAMLMKNTVEACKRRRERLHS